MNLIIILIVYLIQFNLILCAYKKKKNEICSLQVNGLCYDDELNDKPIKIVHDEHGIKSVTDSSNASKKKNRKKLSTDILQSKSFEQQNSKSKFKLFGYNTSKFKLNNFNNINNNINNNQNLKNSSIQRSQQQLDQPKLIFKYHKLNNINNQITNSLVETSTNQPANNLFINQFSTTLNSPSNLIKPTINPALAKFKIINRPLLGSSSFNSPFFNQNNNNNKFSLPLINNNPFINSLTLKLPENYNDNSLFTDTSLIESNELPTYDTFESLKLKPLKPTILSPLSSKLAVSNYLPKNLNRNALKNLSFSKLISTTQSSNQWSPTNFLLNTQQTIDTLTEPLPTNLTNYINLRESGRLKMKSIENTTQDRIWSSSSDEDDNTIFPTKTSELLSNDNNNKNNV